MITVNSLSGGKTSSYIAANYPADYNVFALVRTSDKSCMYPDAKMRQKVSDKLGAEFIGTLEDDVIINTMFDLEQYIGTEINWVTGLTFDEVIYGNARTGKINLPSMFQRSCTSKLKVIPIKNFWYNNIKEKISMRIGFRPNETGRAKNILSKCTKNGFTEEKFIIGKHKNGNNKWQKLEWRRPEFPLIKDRIFKDKIENYWEGKPVRFAYMNNCVGCFHRNPVLLKHMSKRHPNKFKWFVDCEAASLKYKKMTWIKGIKYQDIEDAYEQFELFDDDFNECDSGYCGL